ncbi:expressed protein [Phakopsora pachyrhizi]|uniref:Expressed protein n=1 Tax=Phakopsora pachyrhizi TaxID=170000 RepID=A0AAV0BM25_PHAPC|nr:expressed protein [Phakopsora pachyrhizi]
MDIDKLVKIKESVDDAYHPHASPSVKRLFWFMVAFFPLVGVCHILTMIQRHKVSGAWLFRKCSQGYVHPHMNMVMPLISLLLTIAITVATILLQFNLKSHIKPPAVIILILSFNLIHSLNWSRTFSTVYAMPPASSHLSFSKDGRRSLFSMGTKILSPKFYNALHALGYLWGIFFTVLYSVLVGKRIRHINYHYELLSSAIENTQLLLHSNDTRRASLVASGALHIKKSVEELQISNHLVFKYLKSVIMSMIAINVVSIALLGWSTTVILICLSKQVKIYQDYLNHRKDAVQLGMLSTQGEKSDPDLLDGSFKEASLFMSGLDSSTFPSKRNSSGRSLSFYTRNSTCMTEQGSWRDWLPTLQRGTVVEQSLWRSNLMGEMSNSQSSGQARLKSQYRTLKRYAINTFWQSVTSMLLCFSYMSFGITM